MSDVEEGNAGLELDEESSSGDVEESAGCGSSSNLQHLNTMCHQYANYIYTDCDKEVKSMDDSIEEMLIRLDEFKSIIEMISGDSGLCLQKTMPQVYQKSLEMQRIFHKIDQLEQFVHMVSQNLSAVEEQVNQAEAHMGGTLNAIKKIFHNLPFKGVQSAGNAPGPRQRSVSYTPCHIFHTDDYLQQPIADTDALTLPQQRSSDGETK